MEEEEENMCDGAIYADPGPVGALGFDPTQGGYLRGMHIEWRFLSGGLQLGGVISGVISGGLSPAFVEMYNIWRVVSEAYAYLAGHPFLQILVLSCIMGNRQ